MLFKNFTNWQLQINNYLYFRFLSNLVLYLNGDKYYLVEFWMFSFVLSRRFNTIADVIFKGNVHDFEFLNINSWNENIGILNIAQLFNKNRCWTKSNDYVPQTPRTPFRTISKTKYIMNDDNNNNHIKSYTVVAVCVLCTCKYNIILLYADVFK